LFYFPLTAISFVLKLKTRKAAIVGAARAVNRITSAVTSSATATV
jgi:hypothetical protein